MEPIRWAGRLLNRIIVRSLLACAAGATMAGPLSGSGHRKLERRIVEKNRRNHLKFLYSQLFSLLPNHPSKAAVPLPDQIDETMRHIKGLQAKLERLREKKEALLMGRRRVDDSSTGGSTETLKSSPRIQISHKDSALDVFLITGHDEKFMFYETIRIIHEHGAEVVNANFSVHGDSIFHVVHAKSGDVLPNYVGVEVSNKLKDFVKGCKGRGRGGGRMIESQPESVQLYGIQGADGWDFGYPPSSARGHGNVLELNACDFSLPIL